MNQVPSFLVTGLFDMAPMHQFFYLVIDPTRCLMNVLIATVVDMVIWSLNLTVEKVSL